MARIARFKQIDLQTHRLRALLDFYRDTLGLAVGSVSASGFTTQIGASRIRFTQSDESEPVYHLAFNIPENRIDAALHWLKPRAELIPHHQSGEIIIDWPAWNAHSIYFLDPAGNVLELIARHDLVNGSVDAFDASNLLCVSEVGLVVRDPHAVIDLLSRTFGLPKKNVMRDFGAVGDDSGLFIISAPDRPWMPTAHLRAQPFPARVVVRHTNRIELNVPGTEYQIIGER